MDIVFQAITVLCALFTVGMTIRMLISFRQERRISARGPLISAVLSLVMLPIFILLSGAWLNLWVGLPILALGLLVGGLRGLTTRLYFKNGQVMGKHSWLFLLGWGLSLALAQLLNLLGSAFLAAVGLVPMYLSTGTQVGMNGSLFLRRLGMRRPQVTQPAGYVSPGAPERAGTPPPADVSKAPAEGPVPPAVLPERRREFPPTLPEREPPSGTG